LSNTIQNLVSLSSDENSQFDIYIYYRGDSLLIQYPDILSEIENIESLTIRDLNSYCKINYSHHSSIAEQLLAIYLTDAEQIIYFDPFVLWLDFPRTMFEYESMCCFESHSRRDQETHHEVISWSQKNLKYLPTYKPPKISGSVVKINRNQHWLSIYIAMGILRQPISNHLTIGDALYLSQESLGYTSNVVMMGGNICEHWLGRSAGGLFIGNPLYQMGDCIFYRVPIWYTKTPPPSQVIIKRNSSWYFEKRLGSLVTIEDKIDKLDTKNQSINRLNKMYL
jgi:hypothetical protein